MKNKIFLVLFIGFLFFFLMSTNGYCAEKWVSFAESEKGDEYYYDASSLKEVAKRTIQVWRMKKLSALSKTDYITRGKKYDSLASVNTLVEFDCRKMAIKSLSLVYYDDKGNALESYVNADASRRLVRPLSRSELLLNTVCSR